MSQGDDSVDSNDRGSCKRRVRGVSSHNKVTTASRLPTGTGSQDGCLMREEEMKMKIDVEIRIVERWKGVTRYLSSTLVPCRRNLPLPQASTLLLGPRLLALRLCVRTSVGIVHAFVTTTNSGVNGCGHALLVDMELLCCCFQLENGLRLGLW